MAEAWTIGRLLKWTADYLKSHGSESPRLEAELLLAHARGCQRIELYTAFEEEPPEDVRTQFRELVRRRAEGMPVAYLLGRREFYSLSFQVSPEVLIPRPQTEDLVVRLLDILGAHPSAEIADVGTGSGIIAVCAARLAPECKVLAVDISPEALAVAQANARALGVSDRVEFAESDLLASVPPERMFEVVASNPPYVAESEMAALAKDVRDYEPRGALVGGPTGTEVIARLIPQAAEHLLPGGWLLMEISPQIQSAVEQLLQQETRLELHPTLKDSAGKARVAQARRRA